MPKKFQETLLFEIKASNRVKSVTNFLHVNAFLACWLNDLALGQRLAFAVLVLWCWGMSQRSNISASCFLRYSSSLGWEAAKDGENFLAVSILDATVITQFAIFLQYQTNSRVRCSLLVVNDSMSVNQYRRLMVMLKISEKDQG